MTVLPLELYRPIIESVDRGTLHSLCLTSSSLLAEAEQFLYSDFLEKDLHNQLLFHRTVTNSPHHARMVHKYALWENLLFKQRDRPARDAFWAKHLREILQSLPNLKHLSLREYDGRSCSHVLEHCTFQLHSLKWGSDSTEPDMLPFLRAQKDLRTLHLMWPWSSPSPEPTILPKLHTLVAYGTYTIRAFLPMNSVKRLIWDPSLHDPFEPQVPSAVGEHPALVDALGRLEHVRIGGFYSTPPLRSLVSFLKSLTTLELIGCTTGDDIRCIKELPCLRSVVLTMSSWDTRTLIPLDGRHAIIAGLFQDCPALEDIFIEMMSEWPGYAPYEKWTRGWDQPVDVHAKEVFVGNYAFV